MSGAIDPYYRWLSIPPHEQPANYYRLLGVSLFESDEEVIAGAADRQMMHVKLHASGPHAEISQRVLNELAQAKRCLLDRQKRLVYDQRLRQEQGLPDPAKKQAVRLRSPGESGLASAAPGQPQLSPPTPVPQFPTAMPTAAPPASPPSGPSTVAGSNQAVFADTAESPIQKRIKAQAAQQRQVMIAGGVVLVVGLIASWFFWPREAANPPIAGGTGSPAVSSEGETTPDPGQTPSEEQPAPPEESVKLSETAQQLLAFLSAPGEARRVQSQLVGHRSSNPRWERHGGPMVGLHVDLAENSTGQFVQHFSPIFLSANGDLVQSRGASAQRFTAIAKPDYAVSGLEIAHDGVIRGGEVIFMRMIPSGLDPKDTYRSPWFGNKQGKQEVVGGESFPVLGLGSSGDAGVTGVGLVQLKPPATPVAKTPPPSQSPLVFPASLRDAGLQPTEVVGTIDPRKLRYFYGNSVPMTGLLVGSDPTTREIMSVIPIFAGGAVSQEGLGQNPMAVTRFEAPDGFAIAGLILRVDKETSRWLGLQLQYARLSPTGEFTSQAYASQGYGQTQGGETHLLSGKSLPILGLFGSSSEQLEGLGLMFGKARVSPTVATQTPSPMPEPKPTDEPEPTEPEPAPSVESKHRLPVPDEQARAKALSIVKELYADEYRQAASQRDAKLSLAQTLHRQAHNTKDDAAAQYVLFEQASQFAIDAGHLPTAWEIFEDFEKRFEIDLFTRKEELLELASRSPQNVSIAGMIVQNWYALSIEALAQDNFDLALKCATRATMFSRRTKQAELRATAEAWERHLRELQPLHARAYFAKGKLQDDPDDKQSQVDWGLYLCLHFQNWPEGLKLLAASDQSPLAELAELDLTDPTAPQARADLADKWWDLADQTTDKLQKRAFQRRAALWYQLALPGLGGLIKVRAEKRMEEVAAETWLPTPPAPRDAT